MMANRTKKPSPAPVMVQSWVAFQIAHAPKLSAKRWLRVAAILGGK
jgi:hypothetical protein